MARKPKTPDVEPDFDAAEYRRVVEEANRQRQLQAEYSGNMGAVMKNGAERLGVTRESLNLVRRLSVKSPAKRDAEIIDVLKGLDAIGLLEGEGLLEGDGVRDHLLRIADSIRQREPKTPVDAAEASEAFEKVLH